MIYTVIVDKNAFGPSGFGRVTIVDQHNSPAKMGRFVPTPCNACITNLALALGRSGLATLTSMAAASVCTTNAGPTITAGCPEKYEYWKKHVDLWPAGYAKDQPVQMVFAKVSLYPKALGKTLFEALENKAGSGRVNELLRQAVAAFFNAATPGILYPFTTNDVVTGVNMALMDGSEQALKSLTELLKEANENDHCQIARSGANCDTSGRPNVLALRYIGQSCATATNSQMAISGKTSCNGDPHSAPVVHIIATARATVPSASTATFFDGLVNLGDVFEVKAANAGDDRFGSNTYLHLYDGSVLVQTIQIHTSCSAPLRRGESFGSLVLEDYRIEP
jgi:hypothetical protein